MDNAEIINKWSPRGLRNLSIGKSLSCIQTQTALKDVHYDITALGPFNREVRIKKYSYSNMQARVYAGPYLLTI